jgi:class 3 adenylate cyclase
MLYGRAQQPSFIPRPGSGLLKRALADRAAYVFGGRAKPALPEHIRREIERQQEAGEIIVGWTQVAAIVFFAVVYAFSPKAFPAGTPFEPVPWTLGNLRVVDRGPPRARLSRSVEPRFCRHFCGCRHSCADDHDLEFSPSVSSTARALPESADTNVRLHLDRVADTAVRAGLRAARRRVRGFGLADAIPFCGMGIGRCGVHAQLRRICHLVQNPARRGDRQDPVNHCGDCHSRLVARQGSRSPCPIGRRGTGGQRSVALLCTRGSGTDPAGRRGRRERAMQRMPRRHIDDRSAQPYRPLAVSFGARADGYARGVSIAAGAGDPVARRQHRQVSRRRNPGELWRAIDELATTAEHWRLEREEHGLPAPRMGLAGAVGDVVFGTVGHATRLEYTVIGEVVNLVAKLEKRTKASTYGR